MLKLRNPEQIEELKEKVEERLEGKYVLKDDITKLKILEWVTNVMNHGKTGVP